MKSRQLLFIFVFMGIGFSGCGFFRYEIIPQTNKGPHGGNMVLIDERVSRYIEFVATPQGAEWLLQLYAYNNKMKPRDFSSYARAEIKLSSDEKKSINLYDTKRWFLPWSPVGHLEGKINLGNVQEFKMEVLLFQGKRNLKPDELLFQYP